MPRRTYETPVVVGVSPDVEEAPDVEFDGLLPE
jgi:hypothetical protein